MWRRDEFRAAVGPKALVAFAGDVLLCGPDGQDVSIHSQLLDALGKCDLVVVNQEGPLTDAPARPKAGAVVGGPPRCASALARMNVRAASLANNHAMDHGPEGLAETLKVLSEQGIKTMGAGLTAAEAARPCIVDLPFGRLALLAYCMPYSGPSAGGNSPGPLTLNVPEAMSQIASLRNGGHIVCVQYHGGWEHVRFPWPERRKLFAQFVDAGAHAVIGHHPHVFQGVEALGESLVAYSLGNFYLDIPSQRDHYGTDIALLLGLEVDARGPFAANYLFVRTDRDKAEMSALEGAQLQRVWEAFREISRLLTDPTLYGRAWRCEALTLATARHYASPCRLPGAPGRSLRAIRTFLRHCLKAPRSKNDRRLILAALSAVPAALAGRRPSPYAAPWS